MIIQETIKGIREEVKSARRKKRTVGFVPTMGFLHEGHLSLIQAAKAKHDLVVVSIFVNPLQFGPNEDFDRYPRDFERDEQLAKEAGADVLFYPSVTEMYPKEMPMTIHVTRGTDVLCGASRPGHFDGVATVVMKLFQIVQPDEAFFGQKDAQQVAIIANMIEAFNVPIQLNTCPTIREEDGLAKSSRNVYLTAEERQEAPIIYQTLQYGAKRIQAGEKKREIILAEMKERLLSASGRIDYVEVLSYPSLKQPEQLSGRIILAIAYFYQHARLIDNYILEA
ncbi:pantoate--beta-alanine ligase [Halalkalibacter akibai]|uniref:Pantothenate synthetase n=1 Tax=Halalkalibacter akibai (strain ATCC 43226 / DSM 21942 / CIP 109018 / JCM 9157 / 1139) TaxID=1236973 RepID=W4QSI6_HALA3|nr:pantoate--beta-alanine ligase [Halalkalibacter akibai]GAE34588.1 pantoate-beta-alanine ligase [Halalkalibacter akibai JCM 9157]